ncbi:MAG: DUF2358 domain-containing protein [Cyanobacteria bacterium Co-bin8]|nr:DUF2358 domain-containing protein [Cyanobacteria bacterium Co-bin8]
MPTNILERIRQDYQRFPYDQSYDLYAKGVCFKDPLTQFQGVDRYRQMIGFMARWFKAVQLDLHAIEQPTAELIKTHWTLSWTAPVPWQPRMSISGRSELRLNEAGLICAHIDYWNCSRLSVLRQLFGG